MPWELAEWWPFPSVTFNPVPTLVVQTIGEAAVSLSIASDQFPIVGWVKFTKAMRGRDAMVETLSRLAQMPVKAPQVRAAGNGSYARSEPGGLGHAYGRGG